MIRILGSGPAGAVAALAALKDGADVGLMERAKFPRHKVCGEFLSPEIEPVLDSLGAAGVLLGAHRITHMALVFGSHAKTARLPEPAHGLSRYTFDHRLRELAFSRGAEAAETGEPQIVSTGRSGSPAKGARLFGFKAHFRGPVHDAVELFFLQRAYVGVNCVESGITNVCGLAPEDVLKARGFEPDSLIASSPALRERLRPLNRTMQWLFTGPLVYGQHWERTDAYLAGDALSFVDPFTGSGLLCAALTGSLAGTHAARAVAPSVHHDRCRQAIGRPFLFSSMLRGLAGTSWAEHLVPFVPGSLLFRLTRPARYTHVHG